MDEPERQQLQALLAEGFPHEQIDWRSAFDAPAGATGHGVLLIVDDRPVGGILTFEKKETIRGRETRTVNLSSWYIRPRYRALAFRMMRSVTSEPDTIYTICSPIASVQQICLHLGFRYLSHGSIASVPLINGMGRAADIEVMAFASGVLGDAECDKRMMDHGDDRHIGLLVHRKTGTIPVLWQRGQKVRGFPAARLLYTTDYPTLRAALPAVHWHMLRHHGILGLYLPRIAPYADLHSARGRHKGPSTIVKGPIPDEDVNLLYSELLYLKPAER